MPRRLHPGLLAGIALVLGALAVVMILSGSSTYRVRAVFADAGQLVKGDLVTVAGRPVGKITAIELTAGGRAELELTLKDKRFQPLHRGTIATIRAVGLSAIANRFVELSPGPPNTPAIADGGLLPERQTRGIVDLDTLLNSLTPAVRANLQSIVRDAAHAAQRPAAEQLNAGLAALNPALGQTAALGREVVLDQAGLTNLVRAGATVTRTLARQRADLGGSVEHAAQVLGALAGRRARLADALTRAPAVSRQAQHTLARVDRLLPRVGAALDEARPALPPLRRVARRIVPLTRNALPAIRDIRTLLIQSRAALRPVPALTRKATPALGSTGKALTQLLPIVAGLRVYAPDVIAGFFDGFGGSTGGYYDANGHYLRISLQGSSASLPGLVPAVPENPLPVLGGYRTGLDARCPGAAEEAGPDGSNPWQPKDLKDLCDPKDGHR